MKILVTGAAGLILTAAVVLGACKRGTQERAAMDKQSRQATQKEGGPQYSKSGYDIARLSGDRIEALAGKLSPQERHVILEQGTERAFTGPLYDNKDDGLYEFEGKVRLDRLLSGLVVTRGMASPTGLLHWLNIRCRPSPRPKLSPATLVL